MERFNPKYFQINFIVHFITILYKQIQSIFNSHLIIRLHSTIFLQSLLIIFHVHFSNFKFSAHFHSFILMLLIKFLFLSILSSNFIFPLHDQRQNFQQLLIPLIINFLFLTHIFSSISYSSIFPNNYSKFIFLDIE